MENPSFGVGLVEAKGDDFLLTIAQILAGLNIPLPVFNTLMREPDLRALHQRLSELLNDRGPGNPSPRTTH